MVTQSAARQQQHNTAREESLVGAMRKFKEAHWELLLPLAGSMLNKRTNLEQQLTQTEHNHPLIPPKEQSQQPMLKYNSNPEVTPGASLSFQGKSHASLNKQPPFSNLPSPSKASRRRSSLPGSHIGPSPLGPGRQGSGATIGPHARRTAQENCKGSHAEVVAALPAQRGRFPQAPGSQGALSHNAATDAPSQASVMESVEAPQVHNRTVAPKTPPDVPSMCMVPVSVPSAPFPPSAPLPPAVPLAPLLSFPPSTPLPPIPAMEHSAYSAPIKPSKPLVLPTEAASPSVSPALTSERTHRDTCAQSQSAPASSTQSELPVEDAWGNGGVRNSTNQPEVGVFGTRRVSSDLSFWEASPKNVTSTRSLQHALSLDYLPGSFSPCDASMSQQYSSYRAKPGGMALRPHASCPAGMNTSCFYNVTSSQHNSSEFGGHSPPPSPPGHFVASFNERSKVDCWPDTRKRRQKSNRESATRTRTRRLERMQTLEMLTAKLKVQNKALSQRMREAEEEASFEEERNKKLKEEIESHKALVECSSGAYHGSLKPCLSTHQCSEEDGDRRSGCLESTVPAYKRSSDGFGFPTVTHQQSLCPGNIMVPCV